MESKQSLNILLAEDDFLNCMSLKQLLEKKGHRITLVSNGLDVLNELKNKTFDLILMDIQMPKMDGIETTKQIRNNMAGVLNPQIPIIAITAYTMEDNQNKLFNIGITDYISKPIHIDVLNRTIDKLFISNNINRHHDFIIVKNEDYIKDINKFITDANGNELFIKDLFKSFLKHSDERINRLKKAILNKDLKEITFASHKITGLFSSIRIMSATSLCKSFEKASRDEDLETCEKLFEILYNLLDQINTYIKSYIGEK